MKHLDDVLDLRGRLGRHLEPRVDRVDRLVAETLGGQRGKISIRLKDDLMMGG